MFHRGFSKHKVLNLIKETILHPDQSFTQKDGRIVAIKMYPGEVGEIVQFEKKRQLYTRLLKTIKVVFEPAGYDGKINVITAYPLFVN